MSEQNCACGGMFTDYAKLDDSYCENGLSPPSSDIAYRPVYQAWSEFYSLIVIAVGRIIQRMWLIPMQKVMDVIIYSRFRSSWLMPMLRPSENCCNLRWLLFSHNVLKITRLHQCLWKAISLSNFTLYIWNTWFYAANYRLIWLYWSCDSIFRFWKI